MTNLERTWWFCALAGGVSAFGTRFILDMAGIASPSGAAQWTLFAFCFFGVWRLFAAAAWLAVLLVKPTSRLLDRGAAKPGRAA
ncbi:hypothetical protein LQ564_10185 [Massilia sp. G4R7]|uniref:Uncharacterized protein n=1 Tax=Massilia phyllostachyos TaxID=2898585 RepID=A0ABS8Q4K0_9BURK|nr:hypothetical protein [Massilia phyllostachyos]MCD2516674.1 hypothetical protein [Massilia phyllostachyos]